MKAFGHRRTDARTCRSGCCGVNKANARFKLPANRRRIDRAARKRARRESIKMIGEGT